MAEYITSVTNGSVWYSPKSDEIGVWDSECFGMWTRRSGFTRRFVHTGPLQWFSSKTDKQIKQPSKLGWIRIGRL